MHTYFVVSYLIVTNLIHMICDYDLGKFQGKKFCSKLYMQKFTETFVESHTLSLKSKFEQRHHELHIKVLQTCKKS